MRSSVPVLLTALALGAGGCAVEVDDANPPAVEQCAFERDVFPVLARDCGFGACHGSEERFFQVFGPGRTRLDPTTGPFEAVTDAELARSFDRARSMLSMAATPEASLLLRKPLSTAAGGAAHMGRDARGRDVYLSRDDSGWVTLSTWANGGGAPCE